VVFFAIAIPLSNQSYGFVNVVSNVTYYGGLISLALLIVLGVVALFHLRRRPS
jgi:hypothetical protein